MGGRWSRRAGRAWRGALMAAGWIAAAKASATTPP